MENTHPTDWQSLHETIISCRLCPRLVEWREEVARVRRRAYRDQEYWGRPVPGFGDPQARVLVVGLAPAAHGANRTGRNFTGDSSGDFLYRALHKAGFANQPISRHRDDGLALTGLYIAPVCRCAPPANRPTPQEIANCLPYLEQEWRLIDRSDPLTTAGGKPHVRVVAALGQIAFDHVLRLLKNQGHDLPKAVFGHGTVTDLGPGLPWLVASYHPSRQNTQTGRLTEAMFDQVWAVVRQLADAGPDGC